MTPKAERRRRQEHQNGEHHGRAISEHASHVAEDALHRQILKFTSRYMMKLPTAIQAPASSSAVLVMSSCQTLA